MPTKRRVTPRKRKDKRLLLLFEDRPVSHERWDRHRKQIMREEGGGGRRPPEWWEYEKGMSQPDDQEAAGLYEMGELRGSELARLMKDWREWWEKAQAPNFMHCVGPGPGEAYARWLEGAAARKAHYRWAGIPVALIKQWNAERRRSAKVVRELEKAATG